MQQDIGARPELLVQGQHVAIRIGCHFGPVVLENKDIFGASVHTANRMTSQAKAGQIILSADGFALFTGVARGLASRGCHVAAWYQRGNGTLRGPLAAGGRYQHAALDCHGRHARRPPYPRPVPRPRDRIDDTRNEITMGRAEENSVVQKGTLISRLHARIELVRGRFLLVDQSTNGTFVLNADGKESFVRRDSVTLQGEGCIGLGKLPDPNAADVIRFALED